MKAELVKRQDRWDLYGEDGSKIASSAPNPFKRLSIKNCEAIANGYDLDELAEKATNKQLIRILGGEDKEEVLDDIQKRKFYFIEGAKAILELLGDKKFSKEDVISMIEKSRETGLTADYLILNKQKTEWDVEIEMENTLSNGYKNQPDNVIGFIAEYKSVPKLDADGCLILKRL